MCVCLVTPGFIFKGCAQAATRCEDSFGKTVLDLVDSPPVRDHILQLHLRRVTEQEPRTKPEKLIR